MRFSSIDRGEALISYALIVALIAIAGIGTVKMVGEETSEVFQNAASAMPAGESQTRPELTPLQKWEEAKAEYADAVADAKSTKAADRVIAKAEYNAAKQANKILLKPDRKAANKVAKAEYNAAKKQANASYKAAVQSAKDDRSAAKAEYQASK